MIAIGATIHKRIGAIAKSLVGATLYFVFASPANVVFWQLRHFRLAHDVSKIHRMTRAVYPSQLHIDIPSDFQRFYWH